MRIANAEKGGHENLSLRNLKDTFSYLVFFCQTTCINENNVFLSDLVVEKNAC